METVLWVRLIYKNLYVKVQHALALMKNLILGRIIPYNVTPFFQIATSRLSLISLFVFLPEATSNT